MAREGLMDDSGYHGMDIADDIQQEVDERDENYMFESGKDYAYRECARAFYSWANCKVCPIENCKQYKDCEEAIYLYMKGEIDG